MFILYIIGLVWLSISVFSFVSMMKMEYMYYYKKVSSGAGPMDNPLKSGYCWILHGVISILTPVFLVIGGIAKMRDYIKKDTNEKI